MIRCRLDFLCAGVDAGSEAGRGLGISGCGWIKCGAGRHMRGGGGRDGLLPAACGTVDLRWASDEGSMLGPA